MHPVVLLAIGGVFLVLGADVLVRSASRLAATVGISPLVVGLTVVAFGTSAPELAVTVGSAYSGHVDVALGNVVGSNIFNVLFILGLSAVIVPLVVAQHLVRVDVPLMIGASALVMVLALDGSVGRLDGLILVVGIVIYTVVRIRQSRTETMSSDQGGPGSRSPRTAGVWRDAVLVAVSLGLLVAGSRWLVDGAVDIATSLGVSQLVIGLTIVAAGTSLPEVATSVLAALRGERDIAVGNIVGSNLFNLLAVLGLGSLVAPGGVPVGSGALTFDLPVMLVAAIVVFPVVVTGHVIARWEGWVFLGYYVAYVAYLVLDAVNHAGAMHLRVAMAWFVMPLTLVTVAVSLARHRAATGRVP